MFVFAGLLVAFCILPIAPLAAQSTLSLIDPRVTDIEGGLGTPEGHVYKSDDKVYFVTGVGGFRPAPQTKTLELQWEIEVIDAQGRPLEPVHTGKSVTDLSRLPSEWTPRIEHAITLPEGIRKGTYRWRLKLRDSSGQEVSGEEPFPVVSRYEEPTEQLALQGFRFYRSEYADEAAGEPVFRAGDSVWARFLITGFKTAENNRYDLVSGVSLRNSAGRVIFSEARAAAESKESFYPKTHVPGLLSVRLESSVRPGQYTLTITVSDQIGKQQLKSDHAFRVE